MEFYRIILEEELVTIIVAITAWTWQTGSKQRDGSFDGHLVDGNHFLWKFRPHFLGSRDPGLRVKEHEETANENKLLFSLSPYHLQPFSSPAL